MLGLSSKPHRINPHLCDSITTSDVKETCSHNLTFETLRNLGTNAYFLFSHSALQELMSTDQETNSRGAENTHLGTTIISHNILTEPQKSLLLQGKGEK